MFTSLNPKKSALVALSVAALGATNAFAVLYDQDVTNEVIMGTGVTNGSWTVDQANGVELGLRGKLRHGAGGAPENTFNSNGDGTYSFDAGVAPGQSAPTGVWSFEWAINSDYLGSVGRSLSALTYVLGIDLDPSQGTSFITFDPINSLKPGAGDGHWDHSMGDNSTAQSAGVEATNIADYTTNINSLNIAQQSWKAHWFITGFDPTADGTYNFYLSASDSTGELARTEIQVIVGAGGAPVPDSGTSAALLGAGILGLLGLRRFAKRS